MEQVLHAFQIIYVLRRFV